MKQSSYKGKSPLPDFVIDAACAGNAEAVERVLQHYERLKRRRQRAGPRENHAGGRFPWSCASSRPLFSAHFRKKQPLF